MEVKNLRWRLLHLKYVYLVKFQWLYLCFRSPMKLQAMLNNQMGRLNLNTYISGCKQNTQLNFKGCTYALEVRLSNDISGNVLLPNGKELFVENPRWRPLLFKYISQLVHEIPIPTELLWTLFDIGISGYWKNKLPVIAAIFNPPRTPTSWSVYINPAVFLDPKTIWV